MFQLVNQATRLLTLGNASPCRDFPTGGLFQQVTAWSDTSSARLCHLHHHHHHHWHLCRHRRPHCPFFVLFICCCCHHLHHNDNGNHHHHPEQQQHLPCLCPVLLSAHSPVTQMLLSSSFSSSNVLYICVSLCISLLSGRSRHAFQHLQCLSITKATIPLYSPLSVPSASAQTTTRKLWFSKTEARGTVEETESARVPIVVTLRRT